MSGEAFFLIGALIGFTVGVVLGRIPAGHDIRLPPGGHPPRIS